MERTTDEWLDAVGAAVAALNDGRGSMGVSRHIGDDHGGRVAWSVAVSVRLPGVAEARYDSGVCGSISEAAQKVLAMLQDTISVERRRAQRRLNSLAGM